jgi:6-phosphogluconolactonase
MAMLPAPLRLPAHLPARVYATPAELAAALACDVARALSEGLRVRDSASLVVSGGRSPVAFFEQLSECPLEWARVMVGLVDERWVPPDSPDSNERLVRTHLLRSHAATAQLVPLAGHELTPEAGIAAAERRIAGLPRPFDVVVLGMGTDGHIASWFPDAPETAAAMDPCAIHRVAAIRPRAAAHPRITLTLPEVLSSRLVILQIQGAAKARVLERAAALPDGARWPVAALLRPVGVPVRVYYTEEGDA